MLLYVFLLSAVLTALRLGGTGAWWMRWQLVGLLGCAGASVWGLVAPGPVAVTGAGLLFVWFLVAPPLVRHLVERRLLSPERLDGSLLLPLLRFVLPGPPGELQVLLYRAMARAMEGRHDEAEELLVQAGALIPPAAVVDVLTAERARVLAYARRYGELAAMEPPRAEAEEATASMHRMWRARALVETGRVAEGLLETAEVVEGASGLLLRGFGRLHLVTAAARTGDGEALETALRSALPILGGHAAFAVPYWRGRCLAAAGRLVEATALLEEARVAAEGAGAGAFVRAAADALDEVVAASPAPADDSVAAARERLAAALDRIDAAAPAGAPGPSATRFLVVLVSLVFVVQLAAGGGDGAEGLVRLGALVPRLVLQGDAGRLASAVLLHAGLLHLAFNVLGLHLFGPPVERRLGRLPFLGFFMVTGVVGNLAGLVPVRDLVGVGASGGVMGVIGATVVGLALDDWNLADRARRRYLRDLVVLVGINLALGAIEPQVWNAAHVGGLVAGALLAGLALGLRRVRVLSRLLAAAASAAGPLLLALGLATIVGGLARDPSDPPMIRRSLPATGLTASAPAGWVVEPRSDRLVMGTEDGTVISLVPVVIEGAASHVDEIRDGVLGVMVRDRPDAVRVPDLPGVFLSERDGRYYDEVQVVVRRGVVVVGRLTTPADRVAVRRPLLERVLERLE